jgi:phosphoglycolate phosphatase-like HAD superfamily hydrolase
LISCVANSDLQLLIFDLDGVITSEQKYWNTARLTVWQLLCHPQYLGIEAYFGTGLERPERALAAGDRLIDTPFITELKNRAVNSNWDLTFFVFSLHLLGILNQSGGSLEPWRTSEIGEIGLALGGVTRSIDVAHSQALIQRFWQETRQLQGTAVQAYLPTFARQVLGIDLEIFAEHGQLWTLCYENFQAWYEGRCGYQLPDDETVLELASIRSLLAQLSQRYQLGIATGRPRRETIDPLTAMGLIEYFVPERIVTYDEVISAEALLTAPIKLGKPHPFIVLKAIYPELPTDQLLSLQSTHPAVAYIGDAASDVAAALAAGCHSIGVLTGFGEDLDYKRQLLADKGCHQIIPSILSLPAALANL